MERPSLRKILLVAGGIGALAAGAAAAEGQYEQTPAQNPTDKSGVPQIVIANQNNPEFNQKIKAYQHASEQASVQGEKQNTDLATPQYNGVIVGGGVREISGPVSIGKLFGFPNDKNVKAVALDAIYAANQYNGYLLENPGAKRIAPNLRTEMIAGAQNILQEVQKKENEQSAEFDYSKVINQVNGYIADGNLSADELNKLPKYEITFALAQKGGHNAMTFVTLMPPKPKSLEAAAQSPALSSTSAAHSPATLLGALYQTISDPRAENARWIGKKKSPSGGSEGEKSYGVEREKGGAMDTVLSSKEAGKIAYGRLKQVPKNKKAKRLTKREKKAQGEFVPAPVGIVLGTEYALGNDAVGYNLVGGSVGLKFGDSKDPVNFFVFMDGGIGISPLDSVTKKYPVSNAGFWGKNTTDFSRPWYLGGGMAASLGKGKWKAYAGLGMRILNLSSVTSSSSYLGKDTLLDGPNPDPKVYKTVPEIVGSVGVKYNGIEGDATVGYSPQTKKWDLGVSMKYSFGKKAKGKSQIRKPQKK